MNLTLTKESLKARDYDGIPLEVCQAAYDTVVKEKFKTGYWTTVDPNFIDWMNLAQLSSQSGKVDFIFITVDCDQPLRYIPFAKKQIAFYGISPQPLRAYFNVPAHYDKWLTIEIGLGDGLFVARKI